MRSTPVRLAFLRFILNVAGYRVRLARARIVKARSTCHYAGWWESRRDRTPDSCYFTTMVPIMN
jgi:hypothetical protein